MSSYQPVWPVFEFGWRAVVGSTIGFLGAAMGSAGGVGGGGIYVPMLTLIIGFDPKSAVAVSKCMIMGASGSTVYYNLKIGYSTLGMPLIDYDLALLFQPMLMLGISIGVAFNIVFPDWLIVILLIILFMVTSVRAISRGLDTWKKESLIKKEAAVKLMEHETKHSTEKGTLKSEVEMSQEADIETTKLLERNSLHSDIELKCEGSKSECTVPFHNPASEECSKVSMLYSIRWTNLSLLVFVWVAFFVLQIMKKHVMTCSIKYWILNLLQVPVAVSVTMFEAVCLFRGTRVIASMGEQVTSWRVSQLLLYCFCGILAGTIVGTLGLGGGFILTPLFLEMGIPPQVAGATATFSMAFSSSMSVVQYYILKRFPVRYALYLFLVATTAAFTGQHVVGKLIRLLGRSSIIIFILAGTILLSALSLGGVGITHIIEKLKNHEYMGFESLCHY